MRLTKAVDGAHRLHPRALLVVHGSADDLVPDFDARVIADAHTAAELRLLDAARHRLRHDPRAMAILLGWLDRQRNSAVPPTAQLLPRACPFRRPGPPPVPPPSVLASPR